MSASVVSYDPILVLLKEYDALYQLVIFRMTSLDRRAPIAGATLAASLATGAVLPSEVRTLFLIALPAALIWFLRTTVNHARSFEDVLARLAEIERAVNERAGAELLVFQSRHPSRSIAVGGRTGRETVNAVFVTCVILLLSAVYLTHTYTALSLGTYAYDLYAVIVLGCLIHAIWHLRRYRYARSALEDHQVETAPVTEGERDAKQPTRP